TPHHHFYALLHYSSATHRHLHSFPTRRSSDLVDEEPTARRVVRRQRHSQQPALAAAADRRGEVEERRRLQHAAPDETDTSPLLQDRKSTRLNSSHLGISYAVFCLKKKNIKNAH